MTTWIMEGGIEIGLPPTPEEVARVNVIREEKSRPENVVVLPLSAVPPGYRHFLSEGDRDA